MAERTRLNAYITNDLAAVIVVQAIIDLETCKTRDQAGKPYPREMIQRAQAEGYRDPVTELLDFFNGDWFEELCDMIEVDALYIRRRLPGG